MPTDPGEPRRAESREIEMKLPLAAPAALREQLQAAGARFVSRVFESNRMFDTPDGELRRQGRGLRVRVSRPIDAGGDKAADPTGERTLLTCKGPKTATRVKSREEIELEVQDADRMALILERLGFAQTVLYEKRRETWTLDDCEVVLDELPELGWWVEIEGPSESAITAARRRLSLAGDPVTASYVELAAATVAAGKQSIRLTFADDRDLEAG